MNNDPKDRLRVSIQEVQWLQERRQEINSIPLESIIWTDEDYPHDGDTIPCPPEMVKRFQMTGLSNIDFVEFCFCEETRTFRFNQDEGEGR